jgi:hypothetical protein
MLPELAGELRRFPAVIGEDRIFRRSQGNQRTAARGGTKLGRQDIAWTGGQALEIWKQLEGSAEQANIG